MNEHENIHDMGQLRDSYPVDAHAARSCYRSDVAWAWVGVYNTMPPTVLATEMRYKEMVEDLARLAKTIEVMEGELEAAKAPTRLQAAGHWVPRNRTTERITDCDGDVERTTTTTDEEFVAT